MSLNAARTFYLPGAERVCQDCHMPLEEATLGDVAAKGGMVKSHRFLAVNTALPFLRGDSGTIARIEEFLRDEKLRVDLFAVRRENGGEVLAPAGEVAVSPGERIQFDVVVRNKGVGHTFPGGTNDSNEGWLEVTVADEQGRALAASGLVRQDGHVDPGAHFYKALLVDRHGEAIHKRNAQGHLRPGLRPGDRPGDRGRRPLRARGARWPVRFPDLHPGAAAVAEVRPPLHRVRVQTTTAPASPASTPFPTCR